MKHGLSVCKLGVWAAIGLAWAASSATAAAEMAAAANAEHELATLEVSAVFVGMAGSEQLAAKTAAWFVGHALRFSSREDDAVDTEAWLRSSANGLRILVRETATGRLRLWFVLQRDGARRYLVREQTLPSGLDEVGLENIAQLLFSSALALAEGREETPVERVPEAPRFASEGVESVRERAPRRASVARQSGSIPSDPARASREGALQLGGAVGYELRVSGPEGIFQGPVLALGVQQKRSDWDRTLTLAATLLVPGGFESTDYAVNTKGYSGRVQALAKRSGGDALSPEILLALGLDWLTLSPETLSTARFTASGERRSLRPFVAIGGGLSFRIGALSLSTELEAVAHLSRTHYDVEEGGVRRESLVAWPLQPALRVALRW
ncbi:MAG TPA: hypothetical protein VFQ35_23795 [Polyangiaceae bacterium]|nr:hypothetical protein [Polyangiaceae bacterium]